MRSVKKVMEVVSPRTEKVAEDKEKEEMAMSERYRSLPSPRACARAAHLGKVARGELMTTIRIWDPDPLQSVLKHESRCEQWYV